MIHNDRTTAVPEPGQLIFQALPDRNISLDTTRKFNYQTELDDKGQPSSHVSTIKRRDDVDMGVVLRKPHKKFLTYVDNPISEAQLWGSYLFPAGSAKAITVTEGREDAMAAYQMMGSKWPTVSLNSGASHAYKEFKANYEYLTSFEKVYICFDADEPGRRAALECANVLPPGKARIVKLDPELKDACGYAQANKIQAFTKDWWSAAIHTPAGILTGTQVLTRLTERVHVPALLYPFEGLNNLAYGIRCGEAVIVTAPTGVGKSSLLRELMFSILKQDPEARIGSLFLEETPEDTALGLMSLEGNKPFHLPDTVYTPEEYEAAKSVVKDDRVFYYDSFGSNKIDEIVGRVRYYAQGLGCKYIFLDHLSIIVSDQSQGDERKALDSIMTQLKTLTIELKIALIAVVHTNRQGQIRGTAGIEQLANIVINLERDHMSPAEDVRNLLKIYVSKNRFSGRTGPACVCRYDKTTGRLNEETEMHLVPSQEEIDHAFGDTYDNGDDNGEGRGGDDTGTDRDGASTPYDDSQYSDTDHEGASVGLSLVDSRVRAA